MTSTKKRKTDDESKQATEQAPPPPYGSRDYWNERYKKHRPALAGEGAESATNDALSINDALPYHAWYFTYGDLRPLILPLILGGSEEMISTNVENAQDDQSVEDEDPEDQDKPVEGKEVKSGEMEPASDARPPEEKSPVEKASDGEDRVDDIDSDDGDDEAAERQGLAKNGPVSVLEVGCGDMPLGRELAMELDDLELKTGAKAENVVKRIVCCDYSESVIEMLKSSMSHLGQEKHARGLEESGGREDETGDNDRKSGDNLLDFVVADARKLPYSDGEFDLVLEKGTLDAMLSDKEDGVANCVLIVTECARILAVGGYVVIVSHLNAHTTSGLGWLDEVVVPGLRAGGDTATWEIEVHGNDGYEGEVESGEEAPRSDDEGEENNSTGASTNEERQDGTESPRPPSGSPGPAVYIIHKMEPLTEQTSGDPPTIPLKFFGY